MGTLGREWLFARPQEEQELRRTPCSPLPCSRSKKGLELLDEVPSTWLAKAKSKVTLLGENATIGGVTMGQRCKLGAGPLKPGQLGTIGHTRPEPTKLLDMEAGHWSIALSNAYLLSLAGVVDAGLPRLTTGSQCEVLRTLPCC